MEYSKARDYGMTLTDYSNDRLIYGAASQLSDENTHVLFNNPVFIMKIKKSSRSLARESNLLRI